MATRIVQTSSLSPCSEGIYPFADAPRNVDPLLLLGIKGFNLHQMVRMGLPVPVGLTITTSVCREFHAAGERLPDGLTGEVQRHLNALHKITGKKFADLQKPLLLSVRAGAPVSFPGLMPSILNIGLNDQTVIALAKSSGDLRYAFECYCRLIMMFGESVTGIGRGAFEQATYEVLSPQEMNRELNADSLEKLARRYKELYRQQSGHDWPQDPLQQLQLAIEAAFRSANSGSAIAYRRKHALADLGVACTIQAMVFGNLGHESGTGTAFTRNPSTGQNDITGEFLIATQGRDLSAASLACSKLSRSFPQSHAQLHQIKLKLEKSFRDAQDFDFTIEQGRLYLLQTRTAKRTAAASLKIAVDMVKEKLIDEKTALGLIDPASLEQFLHPIFDPHASKSLLTTGIPASPGAASGKIAFSAGEAEERASHGEPIILLRHETEPADIPAMRLVQAILTTTGGMTSHAAVVARAMNTPCITGTPNLIINLQKRTLKIDDKTFGPDDYLSLNGATGELFQGQLPTVPPRITGPFKKIMRWADQYRALDIRANADTPADAKIARSLNARGIGLCRTEHMFFHPDRIHHMREMILASDPLSRQKALDKLLPCQRQDFIEIFREMNRLPVTIRLLDPPLHEFLPHDAIDQKRLAQSLGMTPDQVRYRVEQLHEMNPMLGHRGCRLAVTYPEILIMQVQAIMEAALALKKKRIFISPEIMIPFVSTATEFHHLKEKIVETCRKILAKHKTSIRYQIGTMIEIPRAALRAGPIAAKADFFSFGTNDLTQLTFGFSRDDTSHFLPAYLDKKILPRDPFQSLDQTGVGQLIQLALQKARAANPHLKVGICGEQAGDPQSIRFFHHLPVNYISCSPHRLPIARLAAAQAAIKCKSPLH